MTSTNPSAPTEKVVLDAEIVAGSTRGGPTYLQLSTPQYGGISPRIWKIKGQWGWGTIFRDNLEDLGRHIRAWLGDKWRPDLDIETMWINAVRKHEGR